MQIINLTGAQPLPHTMIVHTGGPVILGLVMSMLVRGDALFLGLPLRVWRVGAPGKR